MKPRRPYDTIGLSKFNPQDPRHLRILQKRNEYREAFKFGYPIRSLKDLFFACSRCGHSLILPHQPGYVHCGACHQYFKVDSTFIRECDPPQDWQPQDPAQLKLIPP